MVKDLLNDDLLESLLERFYDFGLRAKFKKAMGDHLALELGSEYLNLNTELQTKLLNMDFENLTKRMVGEFIVVFADFLEEVVEHTPSEPSTSLDEPNYALGNISTQNGLGDHDIAPDSGATLQPREYVPYRTVNEVFDDVKKVVGRIGSGFVWKDETLLDISRQINLKGQEIRESYGLSEAQLIGLGVVSLYDIVFLCDDSPSVWIGNRKNAIIKTVQSVADWSTKLEPSGISLRFINHRTDKYPEGTFDNLTNITAVQDAFFHVVPKGNTKLGAALERKILRGKLATKNQGKPDKPLIVVVITDGEPTDYEYFQNTASRFKKELGELSTVILLFSVGETDESVGFIRRVEEDERLNKIVYTSKDSLDFVNAFFRNAEEASQATNTEDEKRYKRHILDEFIMAAEFEFKNQESIGWDF
ncbi:hypothetical protein H072_10943 [Dactylellina haptotyla CBS 200.50]|uniref:VWFA domain-containing protein n=1 Tax=Dactylellina haptotyla (strain CBS 200.50) TaxID=1284197 RepID=S8BK95_DACHA|nr:hypothetical protein H072_10943 [Dactylellina haptotyla CBS 200.50]